MILIFGGTTEGRLAVDVCEKAGNTYYYSTKGSMQDVAMHNGVRLTGVMTAADMKSFCKEHDVHCIVDAAHPFAETLHKAIADAGQPVVRLQRSFGPRIEGVTYCSDYADAVERMSQTNIHCLLALSGANTISRLSGYWQHHRTLFRILNRAESIETALRSQFPTGNLIFYNDDCRLPSIEDEKALMQSVGCDAIITKESGASGGYDAKVQAALQLGLQVYVVEAPQPHPDAIVVTGRHGLRRAIEHLVPHFFPLHTGFTTGACATAATKAACLSLMYDEVPEEVAFTLPDDEVMTIPVAIEGRGVASVVKDSSDDPDVTKGCRITSTVRWNDCDEIRFLQGEGVGTVTLPGLGIEVGEPAINPTPRSMMRRELRSLTPRGVDVTISVAGGETLAMHTFNPKVGVVGGISIIGTSGIVSPLSHEAFVQSIRREMEVAKAIGCREIALVSGKRSEDYLLSKREVRCIHYGNAIGEALLAAHQLSIPEVTVGIMLGKAVKLAEGHLDTHSHRVTMNRDFLKSIAPDCSELIDSITLARELWQFMPPDFFDTIRHLCYQHCRTVYPDGKLTIELICDDKL